MGLWVLIVSALALGTCAVSSCGVHCCAVQQQCWQGRGVRNAFHGRETPHPTDPSALSYLGICHHAEQLPVHTCGWEQHLFVVAGRSSLHTP
jgi:hypothetical protein